MVRCNNHKSDESSLCEETPCHLDIAFAHSNVWHKNSVMLGALIGYDEFSVGFYWIDGVLLISHNKTRGNTLNHSGPGHPAGSGTWTLEPKLNCRD